jgi:RNA polymerase sigma factor (sigma-70 family)
MNSVQVGAVLRHLRNLGSALRDQELPDNQLLERFTLHRDEGSFAALLRRHGPMVLGVCRSVLHDWHDAEDAFQAAFLLLAQKAGSIHRGEAVSGWLYRVAYHLAMRAKANAARRRFLEKSAVTMPPTDPLLDMSLREVCAVLLKELEGLPEKYRIPLVLCGMEERSLEEAARLAGWTKWAVKGRLQRGRQLLRGRLRRRGLELPAGLAAMALALNSASAQVPARLTQATLRLALKAVCGKGLGGGVSAGVASLIQGANKTMLLSQFKLVPVLLLIATLGATGLGTITLRALAAGQAQPEQASRAALVMPQGGGPAAPADRDDPEAVTIRGRVLNPDGKPVVGAKLYLSQPRSEEKDSVARATSGDDGRFAITLARSELDGVTASARGKPMAIAALAKGYGFDWAPVSGVEAGRDVTLHLVKDVPIRGRVLDLDGKPVAGAKMRVLEVSAYPGEDLTKMLEETRLSGGSGSAVKNWGGPLPGQAKVLTAGADGRFHLAGFGRERAVWLIIEGPDIEYRPIMVMTRTGDPVLGPKMPEGFRQAKVYGAQFDYLAEPSRLVRGVVRDKDTKKPVPGVTLWSYLTTHRPQTDKEGRFELLGHPKAAAYTLYAVPPDGSHFGRRMQISDTPGFDPLAADIALAAGITVQGRVLDKTSGQPVPGARVSYFALYPNPHLGRQEDYPTSPDPLSSATTGPDGSFVVIVLPGPGVLAAAAPAVGSYRSALVTPKDLQDFFKEPPDRANSTECLAVHFTGLPFVAGQPSLLSQPSYHALALLNPGEKDKGLVRDLELLPPLTRKGTVIDPDGKPLSGVTAIGLEASPFLEGWSLTLKSASFTVRGLHPGRTHQLFFYSKEKNLGRYLELRGDQSEPLEIKLEPCGAVTGRLVDKAGKPIGGTVLYICRQGFPPFWPGSFEVKTNADGSFRAEGLVPGQKYGLTRNLSNIADTLPREIVVESGKKKELGDLVVTVDNP